MFTKYLDRIFVFSWKFALFNLLNNPRVTGITYLVGRQVGVPGIVDFFLFSVSSN
jgi:hypothetical protein